MFASITLWFCLNLFTHCNYTIKQLWTDSGEARKMKSVRLFSRDNIRLGFYDQSARFVARQSLGNFSTFINIRYLRLPYFLVSLCYQVELSNVLFSHDRLCSSFNDFSSELCSFDSSEEKIHLNITSKWGWSSPVIYSEIHLKYFTQPRFARLF